MSTIIILLAALLPVGILAFYIRRKDRRAPEPVTELLKAFGLGVLSTLLSFCLSVPFGAMGLYPAEMATVSDAVQTAFFAAAVPEEVVKFFVLWLLLRRSRYFDERMDGIVYAVFVSLGFAALENFMYLFGEEESVLSMGISRALFAVPAHFGFGILMGYYYSKARFCTRNRSTNRALILIAPILAHGLYDAILFALPNVAPIIGGGLTIVFIVFCWKMWKQGSLRIQKLLNEDFEA